MSDADRIILDTMGELHARGHGLNGYCRLCQRHFDVPLPALIAARGADSPVVGMRPVTCASCGSNRETELRIRAQSKGPNPVMRMKQVQIGDTQLPGSR